MKTLNELVQHDANWNDRWLAANPRPEDRRTYGIDSFMAISPVERWTDNYSRERTANMQSFATAAEYKMWSDYMNSRAGGLSLGNVVRSFVENPASVINPVVNWQVENPKETIIISGAILGAAALAGAGAAAGTGAAATEGTLAGSTGLLTGAAETAPVSLLPDAAKYIDTLLDSAEQYATNELISGLLPKKSGPATPGGAVYTAQPVAPKTYTTELAIGLIAASALLFFI